MPKKLEQQLKREVEREHPGWTQKHKDAYVYGTLRNTGWKPKREKSK